MKSIHKGTGIFMAAVAILALSVTAGFAQVSSQGVFSNAQVVLLTQNHGRTVSFDIGSPFGGAGGLHAIFLLCLNLDQNYLYSNLQIFIANNTPMGSGDELIYFVSGFIPVYDVTSGSQSITPLLQYVYGSAGTFGATAPVPKITYGVILTGVLASSVDFPITLSATFTFEPEGRIAN